MSKLQDIGSSLVEHSVNAEFTARGIVDELFPYIYLASKRMSSRAISEWLESEHNVKVSHVSISKVLKNPEGHFERLVRNIFDAADALEERADFMYPSKFFLLYSEEMVDSFMDEIRKDGSQERQDVFFMLNKIKMEWFCYPFDFRKACKNALIRINQEAGKLIPKEENEVLLD